MTKEHDKVKLHFADGYSDKMYVATVVENEQGFSAVFQYGRTGNVNNHNVKPARNIDDAYKIYIKQVRSKIAKGYRIIEEHGFKFSSL